MGLSSSRLTLCLLIAAAWPHGMGASTSAKEITIRVHNYSRVEPKEMAEAQAVAGRILSRAGVETQWQHCTMPPARPPSQTGCAGAADGVTNLIVRILPEHMSHKIAGRSRQLGTSISTREGVFPTDAYIFFDRVVNLSGDERTAWPTLLGAAMAHEVGHLLLGGDSHSAEGIMRAVWGREEIKQILMGLLTFTPRQAEQMRADVDRRLTGK
jgi:hypothetical protein